MKSILSFLYKAVLRSRRMFSFELFVILLLIGLACFMLQTADITSYDFVPSQWDPVLISIWNYALLSLPIIIVINRLLHALERSVMRLYLRFLDPSEKGILAQFISKNQMLDVPLDPTLKEVKQLVSIGIIRSGSGLTYPASDLHSEQHAYFSMPAWIFYSLKKR
ncbi:MAG: hypothetical protein WEA61_02985 [Anaerolineales bacterium]